MTLVALRTSVIDYLTANMPQFKTVQAHGGKFNREELKRIAMKSPAALVSVLGGGLQRESTQAVGEMALTVFIVTRDTSSTKRGEDVLTLAETVAGHVMDNAWDYAEATAPKNGRIDNLYTGKIDRDGVALWSVSWRQRADLAIFDHTALPDFHTLYVDADLAPADGVIDAQQVIRVGGEFMSAYGHMSVSTAVATAIATPATYVKAAGTTELKLAGDMDMPATNRLRHTGTIEKPMLATASLSVTVSADAKVTLAFAKNGVVDTDTAIEQEVTLAGGAEAFSLKSIASLAANEYLEIWVTADAAVNVTITKASVVLAAT